MWPNKRMDASLADWLYGLRTALTPSGTDPSQRVELLWEPAGTGVVGLSVRSLFDLWLSANHWEPGDRIIFSAFTVNDMPRIAREHGLQVAAVDIDPMTGEPNLSELKALLDDRTRAVVYTHLFGGRGDVSGALTLAQQHGATFVEDCAEAYVGPAWRGHPDSDLALFSFGPIKNATAFGGGLARVPDRETRDAMRRLRSLQPVQPAREYGLRLIKFGAIGAAMTPVAFGGLVRLLDAIGPGHDVVLNRVTRGFPGPEFFSRIRRQPARPLLRLLERRLSEGAVPATRRADGGARLVSSLDGVRVPTIDGRPHTYWLIPVLAPNPAALIGRLMADGYHATQGRAFAVVESDAEVGAPPPTGAKELHETAVFLPFAPEMPPEVLDRLGSIVSEEIARQETR
jgi:dTDP-4-amino-4,6-dideoxygalactose transaminase